MARRRVGPFSAVTAFLVYATTFLLCLVGAGGVVAIMLILILADLVVGLLRGDLRHRLHRPRW